MSATAFFQRKWVIDRLHKGPLGIYIDSYADRLIAEGHCYQSGGRCLRVVGDFSAWMANERTGMNDLNEETVLRYERFRAKHRHPFLSDHAALVRMLSVLREIGAIEAATPNVLGTLEQIEHDFEQYLIQNRELAQASIIRHRTPLRKFLREYCSAGISSFSTLTGKDVTRFLVQRAHDQSPSSARNLCWTLRSFFRYLLHEGHTTRDLSSAVPSIRSWRDAALPDRLSKEQIQTVLDCCDKSSVAGLRDYAVLVLLSRLGLRANECVLLMLDDIDWHSRRLMIRGKGGVLAYLPLISDVGVALAEYLQHARPVTDSRYLFVRVLAPHSGFSASAAISRIATSALVRAGLPLRYSGAHIFRHSLATNMLGAGASLSEIGQVLRHKNQDTTRLYAKVDIDALSSLALPWPEDLQ